MVNRKPTNNDNWAAATNKMRPAKTQISLRIRPVWPESSLCAQWVAKGPKFFHSTQYYGESFLKSLGKFIIISNILNFWKMRNISLYIYIYLWDN